MKILSAAEMREVDRLTTERFGVPSLLLMENAAARTVDAAEKKFGDVADKRVLIVCGRGNNGGDGAAIARLLHNKRASVDVLLLGRVEDAKGDARTNFQAALDIAATGGTSFRFVEIETPEQFWAEATAYPHALFFDAIFGTGLTRPASGLFEEAIHLLNEHTNGWPVISVDIPSGIASDSQELIGPSVNANLTVTFTAPKIGSIFPPAADLCGELVIASIGSPEELINSSDSRLNLVERGDVVRWLALSRRSPHANKGDVGKVLIVAGSRGKTGAACLAGEAALRAGCGLVTIATAESCQPIVASRVISECMTEPLVETRAGSVASEAAARVLELAAERDALAIGPGLGSTDKSTRAFMRVVTVKRQRPMVIDADGLNSLAPWARNVRGSAELPLILTPHPGEMARLVSKPIAEVLKNPIDLARSFAVDRSVILVLKGSPSVIAAPDGQVYVNATGNAGMATGGTGDVLTGMIASFVAQKVDDPLGATIAAVYLHGLAGDIAVSRVGTRAMIASDITLHLGEAFTSLGSDAERFVR
ncbi:MAG TPA: NAD(P)H-hydrate dehydratase [Blastocatellia bacterium]|nr:NAD(P)H-hydrate dehydratase [Blastocatellia bacterium]